MSCSVENTDFVTVRSNVYEAHASEVLLYPIGNEKTLHNASSYFMLSVWHNLA